MQRTLTLLVVLLLPAAFAPAEEGDMTLRSYDVSTITAIRLSRHIEALGLDDPAGKNDSFAEFHDEEPFAFLEGDVLVEIIRSTVEMESWDMEGAQIEYRSPGHLYVRNRAHVQDKVKVLLTGLEAAASRRVLLRVGVYTLAEGPHPPPVPPKDPARDFPKGTLLESGSVETWPGVTAAFKVTNRVRILHDYDVEIAQDSAIAQPMIAPALEGLALELTPHITLDGKGIRIDALIMQGRFERPFGRLKLSDRESGYLGELDIPLYRHFETSGHALIGDGEAATFPMVAGGKTVIVEVRAKILGQRGLPALVDAGMLSLPLPEYETGFLLEDDSEWMQHGSPRIFPRDGSGAPFGSIEELIELIVTHEDPWYWEEEGSISAVGNDRLFLVASPEVQARVLRFMAAREAEFLHPITVGFQVLSTRRIVELGPVDKMNLEGYRLLHGGNIQTFDGHSAFLKLGSSQNYVAGYEVEVAEKAAIADPVIGQSFEGLALNVRPHLSGDRKKVTLDLRFLISDRDIGKEPMAGGAKYIGAVTQLEEKRSVFNTTVEVPAGGLYVMDAGPDMDDPERRLAVVISVKVK